MTARDTRIHGRKTIIGFDLTFGKTTTTPCGKTRPRERTSADPAQVTCPDCRAWAAGEEREMADMASAAARILRENPEYPAHDYTPADFESIADGHLANAARWELAPGRQASNTQGGESCN
jgi:hypothetical protein